MLAGGLLPEPLRQFLGVLARFLAIPSLGLHGLFHVALDLAGLEALAFETLDFALADAHTLQALPQLLLLGIRQFLLASI